MAVAEARDPELRAPHSRRRLERADVALVLGLMALGLGLRLLYFGGFGLGDDVLYRHFINSIIENRIVQPDNTSYRVTWWFPTALACRILGLSELGIILPVTVIATLGIGLVYFFGKTLWGRAGGVIAALLLVVHPLDFAWSTMLAQDLFVSFFSALTILLAIRAADGHGDRRRSWIGAGVSLWLTYHAKVSAVLLVAPIAFICWRRRRTLDRDFRAFLATVALLFGVSALVSYVFTGDPIAPYHAELSFQGLIGQKAIEFHRLTPYVFWYYIRAVFARDQYGDFLFSIYPQLVIALTVLALVAWPLRIRSSLDVFVWLVVVFAGMQFNIQRANGVWVAGFRNVRHIHVLVYPFVLLLTGYLVTLRRRFPRITDVGLAGLLAFSAWHATSAATKSHVAFADCRAACHYVVALPPKPLYTDFQINTWASIVPRWNVAFHELEGFNRDTRRAQIAAIKSGYLVTGGAREPYYGCIDCIPRADEVSGPQWHLLKEFPGPSEPTPWRPEPLRIWEAGGPAEAAAP